MRLSYKSCSLVSQKKKFKKWKKQEQSPIICIHVPKIQQGLYIHGFEECNLRDAWFLIGLKNT